MQDRSGDHFRRVWRRATRPKAAPVNPTNPNAESDAEDLLAAAQSMGMTINVLQASSERDIDAFFATLV